MFTAVLVEKGADGTHEKIVELEDGQLPEGDVAVRVQYSTINYKDALAITGRAPVIRRFPMVPGIDMAGVVEASTHRDFKPGDEVLLNGWGVGESHWGGLAQKARVSGDWLLPLPPAMTGRQAMSIGTAGYTAMLCVEALERHGITPAKGEILVSGANGGVGSIAIAILAGRGYRIVASTGRLAEAEHLKRLGAVEVIDRNALSAAGKPLQKERWAGAVDSVGSHTLANICATMRYGGIVAACGLAQGMDFAPTVAPFILRGVSLIGIDSVYAPADARKSAWQKLAREVGPAVLEQIVSEVPLGDAIATSTALLGGTVKGRVVVNVNA